MEISHCRKAFQAMLFLVFFSFSSCKDSKVIWTASFPSPDEHWIAIARTEQFGGLGTSSVQTTLHLKRAGTSKEIDVLGLTNESAYPPGISNLDVTWQTPSRLNIVFKGHAIIDFQATKCGGIDISVEGS